jgi:hypothetical protein
MNQSSFRSWFQFKASKIIYTVVAKEWKTIDEVTGYFVKIRFRNTVLPLRDWLRLNELRSAADEINLEEILLV